MYHIHDRKRNAERRTLNHLQTSATILSILALLLPTVFVSQMFAQSGSPTIFTPTVIPLSAEEIGNPGRGLHRWNGQSFVPAPMYDSYRRRHWSEIETDTGYNFKPYDTDVQYAEDYVRHEAQTEHGALTPPAGRRAGSLSPYSLDEQPKTRARRGRQQDSTA